MSVRQESAEDYAKRRLEEWGRERERIGYPSLSMFAKIKLERDGAAHRSSVLGDGTLNSVENQAAILGRVLQIERYVRNMPRIWIVVIVGVYVEQQSQTVLSKALGIDRKHVGFRLKDAMENLIAELSRPFYVDAPAFGESQVIDALNVAMRNAPQLTLGPTAA